MAINQSIIPLISRNLHAVSLSKSPLSLLVSSSIGLCLVLFCSAELSIMLTNHRVHITTSKELHLINIYYNYIQSPNKTKRDKQLRHWHGDGKDQITFDKVAYLFASLQKKTPQILIHIEVNKNYTVLKIILGAPGLLGLSPGFPKIFTFTQILNFLKPFTFPKIMLFVSNGMKILTVSS